MRCWPLKCKPNNFLFLNKSYTPEDRHHPYGEDPSFDDDQANTTQVSSTIPTPPSPTFELRCCWTPTRITECKKYAYHILNKILMFQITFYCRRSNHRQPYYFANRQKIHHLNHHAHQQKKQPNTLFIVNNVPLMFTTSLMYISREI